MKSFEPSIAMIALQPTQHARQQSGPAKNVRIRREHAVGRHRLNRGSDLLDSYFRAFVGRVKHTDRVHQLLDCDGRMIAVADIKKVRHKFRCSPLQAIDVDARIEQTGFSRLVEERQLAVAAP
ncbi:hypothetical protein [Sinorhizobium sp. GL28]|uniref:hypothetical protein n=1 Tax=Sinorhizobium sp. GL28 TaxID=1358418 RepID=UPI0012E3A255|nr:hypothetical protein [Sinorhizobium sp. GL28]